MEQAAAYLEQTGEDLATYAALLETHLVKLLAEGKTANHPRSVAATWALSFERVQQRSPASADTLRLCAFLSPEAIPLSLLEQAADALPPESDLVASIGDRVGLNRAISVLLDYSLVSSLAIGSLCAGWLRRWYEIRSLMSSASSGQAAQCEC